MDSNVVKGVVRDATCCRILVAVTDANSFWNSSDTSWTSSGRAEREEKMGMDYEWEKTFHKTRRKQ